MTAVLEVSGLRKHFVSGGGLLGPKRRVVRAVDDVAFRVEAGRSIGLVGESGCGKSTVARCILRLIEPDDGAVLLDGVDVRALKGAALRTLRQRLQIIFQDPYSSLNPRRTIRQALEEPLHVHRFGDSAAIREAVLRIVEEVGLSAGVLDRYPHEFSGGQRQRIGIARALVLRPSFIVADEPVSALDVSVQAQILKLLEELRDRHRLGFVFVSHDLGVVRHFCDEVAIMYLGRIVERGPVPDIFERPLHPYTRMLRDASPIPDPSRRADLARIVGEIPAADDLPPGCPFHTRCPRAMPVCRERVPVAVAPEAGRQVTCHLYAAEGDEGSSTAQPGNPGGAIATAAPIS